MKETAKNYTNRLQNGDFINYLHGTGIDIGGGSDCLRLPPDTGGVLLWDIKDGDAQYIHNLDDNQFDFVYSSHCLEHMRDITRAFTNWLRICKPGGYLYICVPHETYYEKGIWPSINNSDHKHSFTVDKPSSMPANVVIKNFLTKFNDWIEVIDIRENLMNYHFDWNNDIDQTAIEEENICAQIDFIVRKKADMELSSEWRESNDKNCRIDYWKYMLPLQIKSNLAKVIPATVKRALKKIWKVSKFK